MVSGRYVPKFAEASHVLFEGHLDDPSFRRIAIQRITKLDEKCVTLDTSGELAIGARHGKQIVRITYDCPIFGKQRATGHPFKDDRSEVVSA